MRLRRCGFYVVRWAVALIFCSVINAQDIKFAGTQPPDKAVLDLITKYQAASTNWKTIAERDEKRKKLVSTGYFYHGADGKPIDFAGLTARQTKNALQIQSSNYDLVLYQYESTAILTYHSHDKGVDKGKPFEGYGSNLIVMGKEKGVWKITADVMGVDPAPPKPTPSPSPKPSSPTSRTTNR